MFKNKKERVIYIEKVLERIESNYLQVYPFLTNDEFHDLFGEKVINAIAGLNCLKEKCGLCDIEINCPFYSEKLDRCGIDRYKPVHCRLWHCYQCGLKEIVKELRELTSIFADQIGPEKEARKIKQSLEKQDLTPKEAKEKYVKLIEKYRNGK